MVGVGLGSVVKFLSPREAYIPILTLVLSLNLMTSLLGWGVVLSDSSVKLETLAEQPF